jgi:NADPH-dependent curcumin reductase CurA
VAALRLLALHAEGRLKVQIEPRPFVGLGQVADAVEWLLAGRSRGKVVVKIA